jgi:predicted metal-binding protein
MNLPYWIIKISKLITSPHTGEWCKIPYPNHPRGCPNYGKKNTCPPYARKLTECVDMDRSLYIVHSEFDLLKHVQKMTSKHSDWTYRQLKNVLYWQGTSRKQLRERLIEASKITNCNYITTCPEAQGVNVFATCVKSGLVLDKTYNISTCRHIAIMGYVL